MPDKRRLYQPAALNHARPYLALMPRIGIHLTNLWPFGWLKPNRRQRAKAKRGQR